MTEVLGRSTFLDEPFGFWSIVLLAIIGWLLKAMPKAALARPTITLGSPRLVALDPAESASASRLLGSVAAEVLTDWQ